MRKLLLNPTPLFRKLRQLSLLLTLLLVSLGALGQNSIKVANTTIYDSGVITGDDISGTVSIDFQANTLTLTDATINGDIIWDSTGGDDLTIEMSGKNSIIGIKSNNATATCSLHVKKISTAESATLKYTGNFDGFILDLQADLQASFNPINITDGNTTYHYYTTADVYNLWFGGIQVHNIEGELGYKDNIFLNNGTPTATFDGTNTLSLNGVTLTDKIYWAKNADLTINLKGSNSITTYPYCIESANPNTYNISFTKDNSSSDPCLLKLDCSGATIPEQKVITGFTNSADPGGTGTALTWVIEGQDINSNIIKASVAEVFGITIASKQITSANAGDVFNDNGPTVSFDPASSSNNNVNTLTLTDATINGTIVSQLSNLTISFQGGNSLTGAEGYITSTNNAAPLTLKGGTGTSTLSLDNTVGITAISGFASLTYDGAYLTASRGCRYVTGTNPGIKDIKGGIVQPITITTDEYYPLWVYNHQVSSTNYGNVLGNGLGNGKVSYSATDHKLTLEDVDISNSNVIESELSDYLIIALKGNNSLVVNTGNNSPIMSGYDTATLTFQKDGTSDCRLDIGFYGVVLSSPIITNFASVSYTGLNFISKTGTTLNGTTTYDATLSSATIYPLWIGGTLVTEKTTSGTDATSGNTIWEYNANSNTLTLTNYNNTDYDGHAFISNMANLNVYLVGANTVSPYFQTSTDKAFYTTYTNATLTFSTDENNKGTLDASGFNTFCEGFRDVNGIYCNNGLGYYPGTREIKAKATPTISFNKRQQTGDNTPGDETGVFVGSETLTTTYGSTFYAPKPTFNNGYILNDTTRFEYSYSVDGVVEYPNNGEDANNPGKIRYGEISLLKAGTVTITCSFPGNMQNNPCSASYTLQVNKADAQVFEYEVAGQKITAANGYIDVDGTTSKWGTPQVSGAEPTLSKPNDVTSIITYGSSDNNVATVSETGAVTPKGPGTAIISATLKDDERYNDSTATYTLIVMAPATVSFANATASILNTETYTQAATTIPEGSSITYSTNNTNGNVSVNVNGEVTISNSFCGTVTITATVTSVPDANPQCYYVLSNNAAFQASYTLTVSKIFNDVTFADGQNYATYYNGSDDMTVPEGLTAYLVTGTSGNSVVTYQINYLPKNVPLLLEKSATAGSTLTNTTYSGTGLTDAEKNSNLLQHAEGNLPVANITGGTPYVLYKNEFVKATGTISADHCYMLITNNAPTRGFYSIGDGSDDSTDIEGIEFENEEVSDEWYDLQGRRIAKPTKAGLYIVNGKKVVINNK